MDIESLKQRYSKSNQVSELAAYLKNSAQCNVQLKGLAGSAIAFIASSVIESLQGTHLFVLPDKEHAAYVFNDLENLIGKEKVLFFPMSYKKPYEPETIDNANANKINLKDDAVKVCPDKVPKEQYHKPHKLSFCLLGKVTSTCQ